uniref:Uncharacterized protein n=1 Tax=Triticum urartu TaxID=4572 RepID=A0A8R7QYY8_TRIUA
MAAGYYLSDSMSVRCKLGRGLILGESCKRTGP